MGLYLSDHILELEEPHRKKARGPWESPFRGKGQIPKMSSEGALSIGPWETGVWQNGKQSQRGEISWSAKCRQCKGLSITGGLKPDGFCFVCLLLFCGGFFAFMSCFEIILLLVDIVSSLFYLVSLTEKNLFQLPKLRSYLSFWMVAGRSVVSYSMKSKTSGHPLSQSH